jgi:hypothetical protein
MTNIVGDGYNPMIAVDFEKAFGMIVAHELRRAAASSH